MNTRTIGSHAAIGALELKQSYRASMLAGLTLAVMFHMCLVGASLIWDTPAGLVPIPIAECDAPDGSIIIHTPPPVSLPPTSPTETGRAIEIPDIGTPVAVPDDEVIVAPDFPTRLELSILSGSVVGSDFGGIPDGTVGLTAAAPGEYYPEPDEFVPVQSMPKIVKVTQPKYPDMAVLTRVEGDVWVKVLVGLDGQVRDALIAKESGTNVGFEKAALDAAYQNRYFPAIQNKKPVAVWATYKVVFKLAARQ